jgi:tetratricopeptide (TPR) repeat protein
VERLVQLGAAVRDCGDLARADELLTRAMRATDPTVAAHAQLELMVTQMVLDPEGKADETLRVAEELIRSFDATGDHVGLSKAWRLLALRHWVLAEAGGAERALENALAHARAGGRRADELECLGGIPFAVRYGPLPLDQAEARIHACREQAGDSLAVELSVEGALAGVAAARGRFDEARTRAARANELFAELGRELEAAAAAQTIGYIERQAGDLAAAEAVLRDGCARLQAFGERGLLATTALMLGDVLYALGNRTEAASWAAVGADAAGFDDVAALASSSALRAKLAATREEHDAAEALAQDAVALILRTDFVEVQADVLTDRAEVHELAARADDAAADLRAALELYDRKGVTVSAERVRAKLAELAPV